MGEVDSLGMVDKVMDMVDNMVAVDKMDMEDNIDMANFRYGDMLKKLAG